MGEKQVVIRGRGFSMYRLADGTVQIEFNPSKVISKTQGGNDLICTAGRTLSFMAGDEMLTMNLSVWK
jgi:hypothetical protein